MNCSTPGSSVLRDLLEFVQLNPPVKTQEERIQNKNGRRFIAAPIRQIEWALSFHPRGRRPGSVSRLFKHLELSHTAAPRTGRPSDILLTKRLDSILCPVL